MATPQNYANHGRRPPLLFLGGCYGATAVAVFFGFELVTDFQADTLALFLVSASSAAGLLFARRFSTGVQDRVIRLEERIRLERILPDDLQGRIEALTTDQLIALRFASDGELPGLVRRVLDGELENRKAIKQAVENWRADHQRI